MSPVEWEREIRRGIGSREHVNISFADSGHVSVSRDHLGAEEVSFLEGLVADLGEVGVKASVTNSGYYGRREHEIRVEPPPGGITHDHAHEIVDGSTAMHEDPYEEDGRYTDEALEEHVRNVHLHDGEHFSDFEAVVGWHTRAHPELAAAVKRRDHEFRRDVFPRTLIPGSEPVTIEPQQIVADANLVGAGPYVLTTEYAFAERGYEHLAEWTRDRDAAHREAKSYDGTGLDVRVITRITLTSGWAEDEIPAEAP